MIKGRKKQVWDRKEAHQEKRQKRQGNSNVKKQKSGEMRRRRKCGA